MLPALQAQAPTETALLQGLASWEGTYEIDSIYPTVFTQWLYEIARAAMADELGPSFFEPLLKTRAIDHALPRLLADADSPWWDDRHTSGIETREEILRKSWRAALGHLSALYGSEPTQWTWGRAHTLKHGHPLGRKKPLDQLFDVGPFAVPGGREIVNNQSHPIGPAPWSVTYGPSTRRVIDFAEPGRSLGINPVGQSGVLFDRHYKDQASAFRQGLYKPQHLLEVDVQTHTRSTLRLKPDR
jgi:penicillin amidase